MNKSKKYARNKLAKTLKIKRKSNNLSKEKLAELAGLHRNYVGVVERGKINISIDNIEKLALDIEICDFF